MEHSLWPSAGAATPGRPTDGRLTLGKGAALARRWLPRTGGETDAGEDQYVEVMSKKYEPGFVICFENPNIPGQETGMIYSIDGEYMQIDIDGESEPRQVEIHRSWIV